MVTSAALFLTGRLFVDQSSEGELGVRGALIFALLVALLYTGQKPSYSALACRILPGFKHPRKAFKE